MSALALVVGIFLVLFLWGALLIVVFDRVLQAFERASVRAVALATLTALPVGGVAWLLRRWFAHDLATVFPSYLIGTPFFTWLVTTLTAWAAVYLLATRRRDSWASPSPES